MAEQLRQCFVPRHAYDGDGGVDGMWRVMSGPKAVWGVLLWHVTVGAGSEHQAPSLCSINGNLRKSMIRTSNEYNTLYTSRGTPSASSLQHVKAPQQRAPVAHCAADSYVPRGSFQVLELD